MIYMLLCVHKALSFPKTLNHIRKEKMVWEVSEHVDNLIQLRQLDLSNQEH